MPPATRSVNGPRGPGRSLLSTGPALSIAGKDRAMTPLSILDLSPIAVGKTAREALAQTLDLARAAERLGYQRFWVAEHHNMPGIASAATAVVIGHVAGG